MITLQLKGIRYAFLFFISTLVLFSCDEKEEELIKYTDGIFIVNEGGFGNNNGSLSFYSYNGDVVFNSIFSKANGRSIGDVVQSVSKDDVNAYLVVNNSNKIEVADLITLKEKGVITGVSKPRFMLINKHKGFVSCWGDNSVKVINTETLEITKSIAVSGGPDKMLVSGNQLYVANTGGWAPDSVITVINLETELVTDTIVVKYAPQDMVLDSEGKIWVLTFGKVIYESVEPYGIIEETPSKLYRIDPATNEVLSEHTLFENQHATNLEIDGEDKLYLGAGYDFEGIYRVDVSGTEPVLSKIIDDWAYGMSYENESGKIFVTISTDFSANGSLKRYDTDGTLLGTYNCGIGPNGTTFN